MTQDQGVSVTYTGRDDPFIDRLYRSGLTFAHGQSRVVPPTLAERFLRHTDVFVRTKTAEELGREAAAAQAAAAQAQAEAEEQKRQQQANADAARAAQDAQEKANTARLEADAAAAREQVAAAANAIVDPPKDDTQQLLDDAQKKQDEQRLQEDARFALLDQLDSMDKTALITWAQDKFKQKIPGNLGEVKVRERAKGFIDQYGMP
jgi:hypothetical protein